MICISVFYPSEQGKSFDHEYYARTHMPLVLNRLHSFGMLRYEIDRGLAGGTPNEAPPFKCVGRLYFSMLEEFEKGIGVHGTEIFGDVQNYTDIALKVQISEVSSS